MDSDPDALMLQDGPRAVVSAFAAVDGEALAPAPVLRLARAATALELVDLGPALAACGLAYATPRARHAAERFLAALAARFDGPVTLGPPDACAARLGAEASGVAPLPALVVERAGRAALSRAVALACPPDLLPALRTWLLGHRALPAALGLAEADRTAIAAMLPRATSIAHAAALAGRLGAIAALDPALLAEAEAYAFGEPHAPPRFLPEAVSAALSPGADGTAIAAMAQAVAPHLAASAFCPAPLAALPARPRRLPAVRPASLPLFPEAAQTPAGLRAVS